MRANSPENGICRKFGRGELSSNAVGGLCHLVQRLWVKAGQAETQRHASPPCSTHNGEKTHETEFEEKVLLLLQPSHSRRCFRSAGLSRAVSRFQSRRPKRGSVVPLTPMSVAGVARRQHRRAAIGTAAAVGATASYYTGAGYYSGSPYYSGTVREARAAYYGGSPSTALTL